MPLVFLCNRCETDTANKHALPIWAILQYGSPVSIGYYAKLSLRMERGDAVRQRGEAVVCCSGSSVADGRPGTMNNNKSPDLRF